MIDVLIVCNNREISYQLESILSQFKIKTIAEFNRNEIDCAKVVFIDTLCFDVKMIKELGEIPYYFISNCNDQILNLISYRPYGILCCNNIEKDFKVYKKNIDTFLKKYININNHYIKFEDILFVDSQSYYCFIHTINNCEIRVRMKIEEIFKMLGTDQFFQCHKSYIVNYIYIAKMFKNEFLLLNKLTIPISRSRYKGSVYWYYNCINY